MADWSCNDGLSDDELINHETPSVRNTRVRASAVSPESVVLEDNFITDASNDRPYTQDTSVSTKSYATAVHRNRELILKTLHRSIVSATEPTITVAVFQ